jgi:hypothetical protein
MTEALGLICKSPIISAAGLNTRIAIIWQLARHLSKRGSQILREEIERLLRRQHCPKPQPKLSD